MKNYNENKGSSYLLHLDKNSFCKRVMSEKLPVNVLKSLKSTNFTDNVFENYIENISIAYLVILNN